MSGVRSGRWWRFIAVLAVFGLLAAACGGDDSGGGDESGAATTEVVEDGDPDEGEMPQYGGEIVFARESETASPWTPAAMTCDLSCHQSIRTVY
jgi:hypothetical protein